MIVVMGIVGSGKGTQGKWLAEDHKLVYVSTGDILREHASQEQQERMAAGGLLDDKEIIAMVDAVMKELPNVNASLFDGFPRSLAQTEWLLDQVKAGRLTMPVFLHLNVSKDEVKKRLLLRGRNDDTPEAIEKRFELYDAVTDPIFDYLKSNNVPVYDINAAQTPDEVHQSIIDCLNAIKE
ncbi:MAG TPA: nucleoside monophosphate kinase [Candidatus Saccharimonadales bacterium]|nr:nucleoside monophosphate kinase [Candidatus Saccharimonadales bacterium]